MPRGIPKNGINKGWFKKGQKQFRSDEHKRKIGLANSISQIGNKHSKETKLKISKWISENRAGKIIQTGKVIKQVIVVSING